MVHSIDLRLLGLPPKFKAFRQHQEGAVEDAAYFKSKPFLMQIAPTGIGKSLIYITASLLRGGRTIILTSTKGLQDQLMRDFSTIGLVEVRGRSNHRCELTGKSAAYGLCRWGFKCEMKEGGCAYFDAIRRANGADLVVTNYAFWLSNESLQPGDNLVLDEAHASFDHLVSHYSAEIDLDILTETLGRNPGEDLLTPAGSQEALRLIEKTLKNRARKILKEGGEIYTLAPLCKLCENVRNLVNAHGTTSIVDYHEGIMYVTPVTAATDRLFRGAKFTLLTSATVGPGTAQLLGLEDKHITIWPYDSPFPVENRPVYVLDGYPIDRNTTTQFDRQWAELIDKIIRSRPLDKGIVHTVSYERRERFLEFTKEKDRMVIPTRKNTASTVARFKHDWRPQVLVSPSVTTGYDFPGDECRYQIISKVPFPDADSKLARARSEIFRDYPFHYAWQQIVQAAGRGVRSEDDWCETFIIDSHFNWLNRKTANLAPDWFLDAIQECTTIPRRNTQWVD